jgi:hypothetical protein
MNEWERKINNGDEVISRVIAKRRNYTNLVRLK